MICIKCYKNDLILQKSEKPGKQLFCPGCGWTGNVLDIFNKIQQDIDFVFEKIGVKNDEKNINNDSDSNN